MKTCKTLEDIVGTYIKDVENILIKETTHRYTNNRKGTHLSLALSFDKDRLTWCHVSFQYDIYHMFNVTFSRYVTDEYYHSVEFSSNFYELDEKTQNARIKYFKNNISKLILLVTDNKNILLKQELLKQKQEIEKQLLVL